MVTSVSFKTVSRILMDAWISSPDGLNDPKTIYAAVMEMLRPTMILFVADTRSPSAGEFQVDLIRRYRVPSSLEDHGRIVRGVAPTIAEAVERQRPAVGLAVRTFGDICAGCKHVVLPQRMGTGRSMWCVGLLDIAFILPASPGIYGLDDVDAAILQMLREGGAAKDIATASGLSYRTVQHRIERLKSRFGARSIGHLVALSISGALAEFT
jgi:DNA-binding CsgD family transcriptional regulator